jgi:hypothetical protein
MKLSNLLKEIAKLGQYGQSRNPKSFFISDSYCDYYWSPGKMKCDFDTWKKLAVLSARYQRFVNYIEEIKPEWKIINTMYFADNSIAVEELSKMGTSRQRMTHFPHGDVCF